MREIIRYIILENKLFKERFNKVKKSIKHHNSIQKLKEIQNSYERD